MAVLGILSVAAPSATYAVEPGAERGVVRVVAAGEQRREGTGFVVGFERDHTFLVTAAHVVEGVQWPEVSFAADPHNTYRAQVVHVAPDIDVAALKLRGYVDTVVALPFDERTVLPGDVLQAIGFPGRARMPRWKTGAASSRGSGTILFDQPLDEGYSGGPLLRGGWVVGLVKETESGLSHAVAAAFVRAILEDWGVPVNSQVTSTGSPPRAEPSGEPPADPSPPPPPSPGTYPCNGEVTSRTGAAQPVRVLASRQASARFKLAAGTRVTILQRLASSGDVWYRIRPDGTAKEGWMIETQVRAGSDCP